MMINSPCITLRNSQTRLVPDLVASFVIVVELVVLARNQALEVQVLRSVDIPRIRTTQQVQRIMKVYTLVLNAIGLYSIIR